MRRRTPLLTDGRVRRQRGGADGKGAGVISERGWTLGAGLPTLRAGRVGAQHQRQRCGRDGPEPGLESVLVHPPASAALG